MEKIIFEDLPSTNTPINSTNLNKVQTNIENERNKVANASNVTSLWSGDIVPTALDTNFTATFSNSNLRPYNYNLCYAIFDVDNKRVAIPFKSIDYNVSVTFTGHWGLSSSTFVYLTANFNGLGAFNFQIKELGTITLDKIHLVEIIGIK